MWPPAVVTGISALLNIPVNLVLIKLYGFAGAAAAFSATRVLMFLLLVGESYEVAFEQSKFTLGGCNPSLNCTPLQLLDVTSWKCMCVQDMWAAAA